MLTVSFPQYVFTQGDMVSADVQTVGVVTVENDLSQNSSSHNINGSGSINLGIVNTPGFYYEEFLTDSDVSTWTLGFFPSSDTHYDLAPFPASDPFIGSTDLLIRFQQGFTKDRYQSAYNKVAGPTWFATHVVAGSSVLLVCAVAVAAPETTVTWAMCGKGVLGEADDFAATILSELINAMNVVSAYGYRTGCVARKSQAS